VRLLIVTNDFPPKAGGIQMYLKNLFDAFPDPVHVFAPKDDAALSGELHVTRGHRSYMLPSRTVARQIAATVAKFEPDAVLFGAPHPLTPLGPRLRERFNIPFGILSHGAEVTIPAAAPLVKRRLGSELASADVRFAVSRFTAGNVERLAGKPALFLGAGVEIDTFTPAVDRVAGNPPVIGCVSRFVPRKGQDRVLEAAALLPFDVDVLLVGTGRTEQRLRRIARDLGVSTRFEVDVPWGELPDLYREMDVFVMPCRSRLGGLEVEGLGLVFLEAASSGIPVIAGDSGGAPETVIEGTTGFVATDPSAIAGHLETLIADPALARTMGAAGREHVLSEFTWEKVVARLYEGFGPHLR
jgi:phosphatidylinositol alpha-1,6-mannosyltransferase